jgi:hypothetical protein
MKAKVDRPEARRPEEIVYIRGNTIKDGKENCNVMKSCGFDADSRVAQERVVLFFRCSQMTPQPEHRLRQTA